LGRATTDAAAAFACMAGRANRSVEACRPFSPISIAIFTREPIRNRPKWPASTLLR
jgi:hypothetical protein